MQEKMTTVIDKKKWIIQISRFHRVWFKSNFKSAYLYATTFKIVKLANKKVKRKNWRQTSIGLCCFVYLFWFSWTTFVLNLVLVLVTRKNTEKNRNLPLSVHVFDVYNYIRSHYIKAYFLYPQNEFYSGGDSKSSTPLGTVKT